VVNPCGWFLEKPVTFCKKILMQYGFRLQHVGQTGTVVKEQITAIA